MYVMWDMICPKLQSTLCFLLNTVLNGLTGRLRTCLKVEVRETNNNEERRMYLYEDFILESI